MRGKHGRDELETTTYLYPWVTKTWVRCFFDSVDPRCVWYTRRYVHTVPAAVEPSTDRPADRGAASQLNHSNDGRTDRARLANRYKSK